MPALSPSMRPSSGRTHTWTSSGGSLVGEPCPKGSHPEPRRLGDSPCRRSQSHRPPTLRTPPMTPIGGGTVSGSTSGTQWRRHSYRSPKEGLRGGKAGSGAPPIGRTSWRLSRRSFKGLCSMASMSCRSSIPSSTIGSPHWRKERCRCGNTSARWIPTARRRRSFQRTKSGVDSIGCCS